VLAVFLVLACWAVPAGAADAPLRAGVFEPPRAAPDFSLDGTDGAPLSLARYRGKVVVLYFGFTSCPKICPTTLSVLARARRELGADAADLQVVYVTVDPETDDAPRMRAYLAQYDASFVGGTGSAADLEAVRSAYGVEASRVAAAQGSGFSHSSSTYLIDRDGALRALMPYGHASEDYVHDLRILLQR
jgi:protein SCO1/2